VKSLIEILGMADDGTPQEVSNLAQEEAVRAHTSGDYLAAGEWFACQFASASEEQVGALFSKVIVLWGSPVETIGLPAGIDELVTRVNEFSPEDLARSLVAVTAKARGYRLNPVSKQHDLYGRDAILRGLILNASAGTSTFLWGQKRVGKTSVIQVLAEQLRARGNYACAVFRLGELGPLHEGQIAHRIAQRLNHELCSTTGIPDEEWFGAGMSKLVPFMEDVIRANPDAKPVVIIDEFDDLDVSFYTGERGRLFVKALRSLSEIGVTFFFVGSERMQIIYSRHAVDLNKWVDMHLDCIGSREDCKALIAEPLRGAIEYDPRCVDAIVDYCASNPFYMHLLCSELFKACVQEQRTYLSESDFYRLQHSLIKSIGETNFSHFWGDNPVLDQQSKDEQAAQNCLVLTGIAHLGGSYGATEDIFEVQESLGLSPSERLTRREIDEVDGRLRRRKVVARTGVSRRAPITQPIFSDWLRHHAELCLLPKWRAFCRRRTEKSDPKLERETGVDYSAQFPISEDDLIEVTQNLRYCGRQKDVSEVRVWLRQFDDDVRIEVAFRLLKRLAERGFINEGTMARQLLHVEEALKSKRADIGEGKWNIVMGKHENLAITYVDAELKSGATTARELAKRLRPGKWGAPASMGGWLRDHVDRDALFLIVDDFAGTGSTLCGGLRRLLAQSSAAEPLAAFQSERRVLCCIPYAFPEALEKLKGPFPDIEFFAAHVFGEEVRAFDEGAGIFDCRDDLKFGQEVMLQMGRELCPRNPLGFGNMGGLVAFHNTVPNNSMPIFWSNGTVNDRQWKPLFPRV